MNQMNDGMSLNHPALGLDDKLRSVLIQLFRKIIASGGRGPITLPLLLCAIHARHPEEIEKLFENPRQFDELTRKHDIRFDEIEFEAARLNLANVIDQKRISVETSLPTEWRGKTFGMDVSLEPTLAKTMRAAGKLAVIAGRKKAAIQDIVDALSRDDVAAKSVYEETGLRLKSQR